MKIQLLDAHDRLQHLHQKQSLSITECCQDFMDKRPFGDQPFYLFAHARTEDNGVDKRLIWQPRLSKPKAQTNSMLFKAYPGTDTIKVIWMIPERHLWNNYKKGQLTESSIIVESIEAFKNDRARLEHPEPDDLSDSEASAVYASLAKDAKEKQARKSRILTFN